MAYAVTVPWLWTWASVAEAHDNCAWQTFFSHPRYIHIRRKTICHTNVIAWRGEVKRNAINWMLLQLTCVSTNSDVCVRAAKHTATPTSMDGWKIPGYGAAVNKPWLRSGSSPCRNENHTMKIRSWASKPVQRAAVPPLLACDWFLHWGWQLTYVNSPLLVSICFV